MLVNNFKALILEENYQHHNLNIALMMLYIYIKYTSELTKILIRENRINLYNDCLKFLKTRVELDLAQFKDDRFLIK